MHEVPISNNGRARIPPAAPTPEDTVSDVVRFMRDNLETESLSLARMAAEFDLDHFQMIRMFKAQTGVTPAKFLFALRMERAKTLLMESDRSVTDICFDVGYGGLGTFVSRFTNTVGLSPGRYRSFRNADNSCLMGLIDGLMNYGMAGPAAGGPCGVGLVTTPPEFSGLCFVGCFSSCIPEARPQNCAITQGGAEFPLPKRGLNGKNRYFALGVPWQDMEETLLSGSSYWRAVAAPEGDTVTINLRPPGPLDAPVVIFLPALLRAAGARSA